MQDFQPIDLSGVSSGGLEAGDYEITCTAVDLKTTKNGNGQYIKATFDVVGSPLKLFHNFNIRNESEKAQQIGLGQLKSFLKASGYATPDTFKDLWDMINLKCMAKIKVEETDFGEQAKISYFKPLKKESSKAAGIF